MVFTKYKVEPFSANYHENVDRDGGHNPCGICGRDVKEPVKHWGIVIEGGSSWGDESDDENDWGHMGAFPIGPSCHKRHAIK